MLFRSKTLRLAIMLKDWQKILQYSNNVSDTLKQNANSQLGQYMESGAQVSNQIIDSVRLNSLSAEELLPFFKGQFKVSSGVQRQILSASQNKCANAKDAMLCRWNAAKALPGKVAHFKQVMTTTPTTLQSVEPAALKLNALLQEFRVSEETGDPVLDIFSSLHKARAFGHFAMYLKKVGVANPQVAEILSTKASESMQNAKREFSQCAKIITASSLLSPINKYCLTNGEPSLKDALTWRKLVNDKISHGDPKGQGIDELQKKIFVEPTKPTAYLELAEKFLEGLNYRHAIALSSYGVSTFPQAKEDFEAIMGCGLVELGLYNEASFHLKAGSDYKNLRGQCTQALKSRTE